MPMTEFFDYEEGPIPYPGVQAYDAVTDRSFPLRATAEGHVLSLPAYGSLFVTFGKKVSDSKPAAVATVPEYNYPGVSLTNPWEVAFDPAWGGPAKIRFETLRDWLQDIDLGIRYYSGTAVYKSHFELEENRFPEVLDLGTVHAAISVPHPERSHACTCCPSFSARL